MNRTMAFFSQTPIDSYLIDDDDDSSECESSSEDEIDVILHGTPEQKRRLKRLQNKPDRLTSSEHQRKSSSSEDEFEKEMNAELNQHIKCLERERISTEGKTQPGRASNKTEGTRQSRDNKDTYYDDVYFDSDEEEETGTRPQHAVLSNDDLLYDPNMDDRDQTWIDTERQKHLTSTQERFPQSGQGKKAKKPSSDALLDCPACLTTLCIDCQRHETYKNQYRAMFVMNCVVDTLERLQCPEQPSKKKKKRQQTGNTTSATFSEPSSSSDMFHPVKCSECTTVVALIDEDEVYHFFNVIASHT